MLNGPSFPDRARVGVAADAVHRVLNENSRRRPPRDYAVRLARVALRAAWLNYTPAGIPATVAPLADAPIRACLFCSELVATHYARNALRCFGCDHAAAPVDPRTQAAILDEMLAAASADELRELARRAVLHAWKADAAKRGECAVWGEQKALPAGGSGRRITSGRTLRQQEILPLEERFWSRVDKSSDCWLWTAGTTSGGVPYFESTQREGLEKAWASRWAWKFTHGDWPTKPLWRQCESLLCVNPEHYGANPVRRSCSVIGCDRQHMAKGMCSLHYERARNGAIPGMADPELGP